MVADIPVQTEIVGDGTLTIDDACDFTGLGRTILYDLMGRGDLPYVKVGSRRLIPRRSLVAILASGLQGGRINDR